MPESHSTSTSSLTKSWASRIRSSYTPSTLLFFAVLVIMLISGVVYLLEGETPWGKTVQRQLAKGQPLGLEEFIVMGLWWGTLIATSCVAILLITFRWWQPAQVFKSATPLASPAPKAKSGNGLFIFLTLIAVSTAVWEGYPRLSHSLWNDEEYAMRRYAHGAWEEQKNGEWEFEPTKWTDTLFLNRQGNNHLINSIGQRLTLNVWRAVTGAPREQFSEFALRLPAFFLGMGTIVFTALLGRKIAGPLVGGVAAILLALAPWHVHYMSDAKGYSSLMCFLALHYIGLVKALETDKLRWWLLFAIAQTCYVLSFSGSIYIPICTSIIACLEFIRQGRPKRIITIAGFNLLSALPVIIWIAPSVPQYLYYLNKEDALRLTMDWTWIRDLLCALFAGVSHDSPAPEKHLGTSWLMMQENMPWLLHTGYSKILVPVLAVIGVTATFFRGATARVIILSPLLAAVLSFYHNAGSDHPMVIWYLIFLVIPLSLALALGAWTLSLQNRVLAGVLSIVLVAGYAAVTWVPNQLQRDIDRQPIRQMAQWIKQTSPTAMTATWGVSQNQSRSYLPKTQLPETLPDLEKVEAKAIAENLPLFVYICGDDSTTKRDPEMMAHVRTSGRYKLVKEVPGLEELFSYTIYEFQPTKQQPPAPAATPPVSTPQPQPQATPQSPSVPQPSPVPASPAPALPANPAAAGS